jgi:hypothetical protein
MGHEQAASEVRRGFWCQINFEEIIEQTAESPSSEMEFKI